MFSPILKATPKKSNLAAASPPALATTTTTYIKGCRLCSLGYCRRCWAPDGINFEIMSVIKDAPHAIGLNRDADNEKEPTEILRWGLTHQYKTGDYQVIRRFSSYRIKQHKAKGVK